MKKIIYSDKAPAPIGPYSQAVSVNGMVYISGQIPIDQATGDLVSGSIEDETHQVMKNIGFILAAAGLTYSNIVKTSIFVKDLGNFGRINEVYGNYFDKQPPARETVEVSRLPKDVNIEISCIAAE
ncbi:MAG: RidA family protein [Cyclobacteriaceae bacterium]|nr:RidA family protein [Cyclobacteriaceae bacterium SS2]